MFEKAIELDPRFPVAYVLMGHTYRREWLYRWSQDPQTMERAFELAQKAIELDDSSIFAYELLGYIYLLKDRQHEQAIAVAEKVIALDPNFAGGYGLLAEILGFAGRPEGSHRIDGEGHAPQSPLSGHLFILVGQCPLPNGAVR